MLQVTKIFRFEMAHAIHNYEGACKHIHGHSYELHVSVANLNKRDDFISAPGLLIDFKELKRLVNEAVVKAFDHKLLLSHCFLAENRFIAECENLVLWDAEPTAENILIHIQQTLSKLLPVPLALVRLRLYETKNSYAEWSNINE